MMIESLNVVKYGIGGVGSTHTRQVSRNAPYCGVQNSTWHSATWPSNGSEPGSKYPHQPSPSPTGLIVEARVPSPLKSV